MSCTSCPIYYPTLEEFSNFFQYIQKIEKTLNLDDYGLIKVIPPDGWYHSFDNINEIEDMTVLKPVIQLISHVSTGIYTVNLLEKSNITVNKFYEYANKNSLNKENLSYEEIERKFWRSIGLNGGLDDPMYGADMVGTLFGNDHASSWNINNLQTPLKIIGKNLPGVSNAMLYFGCWRASFAFHTEDMELYSINYLHYGAPKSWYSIPPKYKKRFEVMAQSYYPEEYYQCSEFLRHKTSLISPSRLKDCAIPYHTAVQEKGEFMITFPGSYHQGFNHGFNIAEATNFATERWIEVARDARICHCQPDSVKIDMDIFETLYYRDKMKKKLMLQSHNQNNSIIDLTASNEEGSSAQSDNLLNTNNNEENQWLLRCKCGKRVWYPLIPVPEDSSGNVKDEIHNLNFAYLVVAEGDIFQCVDCGLWCHIECIFGENCTGDTLSDDARCHMCSNLDISSVSGEEDDHLQYQISVSSQRDTLTSCSQEDNNVETENSERITIPKVHKFRPKLRDNITASVYSTSLLKYVDVTGDIVAIDGTNIRIHVKVILLFTNFIFLINI